MRSLVRLFILSMLIGLLANNSKAIVTDVFISTQNPTCFGSSDGFVTIDSLQTTAPTGPYNITINTTPTQTFSVGDTIFNLRTGNFTITVHDQAGPFPGTFFFKSFTIIEPPQINSFIFPVAPTCFGDSNATATVFPGGGTPGYTFLWDNGQTTATATGLYDGKFFVTISDANNCSVVDSVTITEPTQIIPNVAVTDVLCNGENTGSATASPSGGTGTYTNYDWSSSANNTATENNLSQGTYTVTVTDSDGCTNTETFIVGEPPVLAISMSKSDVSCFGMTDGRVTATPSGGTTPYSYAWSDGPATDSNRTAVGAAMYTVTVTDNNGCTEVDSIRVNEPAEIDISFVKTDVLCNGDNTGSATATITGGVPLYSFVWSTGLAGGGLNTGGTTNITNLTAGVYTITVTDALLCEKIDSIEITEPALLDVSLDSAVNPSCVGGADGTIDITVTGGVIPYTFAWSDVSALEDRTGLTAGTYTVTVTDNNFCTASLTTTLSDPAPILPNVNTDSVSCLGGSDGTATAVPTGGSGTYTNYAWSSSANNTDTETGLSAGTYTVTVTDSDGCTGTETFTIGQPSTAVDVSLNKSDATCQGNSDGQILTTPSGGTPGYTFLWNDFSTDQDRLGIMAGTYTVTVTDSRGCTAVDSSTVNSVPPVDIALTKVDNICNGGAIGSVKAVLTSGAAPYSFTWSTGTAGGGLLPGDSTTISNLLAGTYTITVTDALTCTQVDSITVGEPSRINISVDAQSDPLCNGSNDGSIDITVTGGTPGYTFLWNDVITSEDRTNLVAGTYTVTVTDLNGCTNDTSITLTDPPLLTAAIDSIADATCSGLSDGFISVAASGGTAPYTYDWSNSPTTRTNPNVPSATYTVTVTDANNCTATASGTVGQPVTVVVNLTGTDASCAGVNDGNVVASVTGGTLPYTYNWASSGPTFNGQGTDSISGLAGGTYTVTVTDVNGCNDIQSATIVQPAALNLTTTVTDVDCNGASTGSVVVTATGGVAPYTYLWDDPIPQTTDTASNLTAGPYNVTVTDNNGCTATIGATVSEPTAVSATITSSVNPSCSGAADGSATVTASGGTGSLSFLWSDPIPQTTATANNLLAGTYTVTVTDDNGCTATDQVTLTAPTAVVIDIDSLVNVSCNGGSDGFIRVAASGGTAPYTYNWDGGQTGDTRTGLAAGDYTVTVTDAGTCTNSRTITISEPTILGVTLSHTDQSCFGVDDGEIVATPSGGTIPYTFTWSIPNGGDPDTLRNLSPGSYTVTITDFNGCTATASETIDPANAIFLNVISTDVSCNGNDTGSVAAIAIGGAGSFTYSWSIPATGPIQNNLTAGTYTVTATDANGCTAVDSATVNEPDALDPSVSVTDESCGGSADGTAKVTVTGGVGPYSFNWGPGNPAGQGTDSISGLTAGNYFVTVTDANTCDTIHAFTLGGGAASYTFGDSIVNNACNGDALGSIDILNLTGGTAPYTFNWASSVPGPITGQGTASISGLAAGNYTVTISDAVSCDSVTTYTITEPTVIVSNLSTTDASCGATDGTASVAAATGGTPGYTYNWGPGNPTGQGTDSISNLAAGNYTVTITDANNCQLIENFTINGGGVANYTFGDSIVNNLCFGDTLGSISILSLAGGTAPFSFNWAPGNPTGQGTSSISGLLAGNYTVTISDATGCDSVTTYTVTSPTQIDPALSKTDESCFFPGNDGTASACAATGGVGPYTYNWSNGDTTCSISGLSSGTFTLTITDANGCSVVDSVIIGAAGIFNVTLTATDVTCNGGNDGQVIGVVRPGFNIFDFEWSNSVTEDNVSTDTIFNLTAGTYSVTVSDPFGCTVSESITVDEPDTLLANLSISNESCNPGADGTAKANPTGGTGPYTYNWGPGIITGQGTDSISNLVAGNYFLTLTDASLCDTVISFTIIRIGSNYTFNDSIEDNICNGDALGSIDILNLAGGVAPYSFNWASSVPGPITGQGTASISGLAAGGYTVTISDANSCDSVVNYTITEPSAIVSNLVTTDAQCGIDDGTANVTGAVGGTAPYTYNWGPGSPIGQGTASIDSLAAGNYTVTITDANNCELIENFTINGGSNIDPGETIVEPTCNGGCNGSITLSPSGGTAPYSYLWDDASTNFLRVALCAGDYTVTITDASVPACTRVETFTVGEPLAIIANITATDEDCGLANATAKASPVNGTAPYSYNWDGPGAITGQGTDSISGLIAGNYTLTVTDANSCSIVDNFIINGIAGFTVDLDSTDVTCNGGNDGTITVNVGVGAIAPISYAWSDVSLSGSNPTNVRAGTYTVTVTDANSCTASESITLNEPTAIDPNLVTTDENCGAADGTANVVGATGGTGLYTYNWAGPGAITGQGTASISGLIAGAYTLTLTDANLCDTIVNFSINATGSNYTYNDSLEQNNCNGDALGSIDILNLTGGLAPYSFNWASSVPGPITGQGTASISGLAAGNYTVTITDANNCDSIVNYTITEPSAIVSNLVTTDASCSADDGTANVTGAVGGTAPYTYNWGPGSPIGQGTASVDSLAAGNYTVTITDANNCELIENFTINSGANIDPGETIVEPTCNGGCNGSITLSPSGGVAPYSYLWDDTSTNFLRLALCAGDYTVTITDAAVPACTRVETFTVGEPLAIQANLSLEDEDCGLANGTAKANPTNGTTPYSYNWDGPGTITGQGTDSISGLIAGNYTVTITDVNSCSTTENFTINGTGGFTVDLDTTDVTCNGGNDGTITVRLGAGAVAPITYAWSDVSLSGSNPTNARAGTFTVTVTDANFCTGTQTTTVNEPTAIDPNLVTTDENCGSADGTANVTGASGGIGPYTYNWAGPGTITGQGTASISGLIAGAYTLTLTDANLCDTIVNFTINATGSNYTFNDSVTDNRCNGDALGSIEIFSLAGGLAPYSFNWASSVPGPITGQGTATISSLAAGNYTVTISDANNCDSVVNYTVTEPAAIVSNLVTTDAQCGIDDGTANVTGAVGGTAPYTYNWGPGSPIGQGTASIDSLAAGNYTVTITDANNCELIENFTISGGSNIDPGETIVEPTCNGGCDGSITLSPSGGTAPYTYVWDDTSTNFLRLALCAGDYTVTITDAAVPACTRVETFTVGEPLAIQPNLSLEDEDCGLANGTAKTSPTNGTTPYSYNWDGPGTITGQGTDSISDLIAGNYTVTITDANNCSVIENFSIGGIAAFTIDLDSTDVTCNGGNDGTITVTLGAGAVAPITYAWSDVSLSGSNPTNARAGTYTVTVTDANNCLGTASITVNEPTAIDPNLITTDENCGASDGTANVVGASGGTGPYTYNWTGPGAITGQGTASISGLIAGAYTLTLTDANLCDTIVNFTINSVGSNYTFNDSVTDNICNGDAFGSIEILNLSGGTTPYSFTWAGPGPGPITGQGTASISGLAAGSYTVTISDANNCDSIVNYTVTEPSPILVSVSTEDANCGRSNGTAKATASGGTGPYQFRWGPGNPNGQNTDSISGLASGPYTLTVTDANNCQVVVNLNVGSIPNFRINIITTDVSCNGDTTGAIKATVGANAVLPVTYNWAPGNPTGQGTDSISGLSAGSYFLTVTDATGCSGTINSIIIDEPSAIQPNLSVTDEDCGLSNGLATVSGATGGTTPYSYNWSGPGPGPITGQGTNTISNLSAGNYFLTITDANNCDSVVAFSVGSIANFTVNLTPTDANCNGANDGEIDVTVSAGAVAPLTYAWSDINLSGANPTNAEAGTYTVTVTDANGCSETGSTTVGEPSAIQSNLAITDENCGLSDGVSDASGAAGGTAPYTYDWSGSPLQTSSISGLQAGNYTLTITDANNCQLIENYTIGSIASYSITIDTTSVTCNGGSDGEIDVTVGATAVAPITYAWSDINLSGSNPTNVRAGTYSLTVTDATGCSGTETITIDEPDAIDPGLVVVDATCGLNNGSADASATTGGTAPYTYRWSVSPTPLPFVNGLAAGSYTLTITDVNLCDTVVNFTINSVGSNYTFDDTLTDNDCSGGANGRIEVLNLSGGTTPYSFSWASSVPGPITGQGTSTISNLIAGNYTLTISDANSCDSIVNYIISEPNAIQGNFNVTDENCLQNDGSAEVTVTGGTAPYNYLWAPGNPSGQNTDSIFNLSAGTYTVTVTDANNCQFVSSIDVGSIANYSITIATTDVTCNGGTDGAIDVTVGPSAVAPITYDWTGGLVGSNPLNVAAGTYSLTVTDATGCSGTESITVIEPDTILANLVLTGEDCGLANGSADASGASGGISPYTYAWSGSPLTTSSISGLTAGNYDVTITDFNNCQIVQAFTIQSIASFAIDIDTTHVTCNGGTDGEINITVGPTAVDPVSYTWSGGLVGSNPTNVAGGTYDVTVTDATGCSGTFSIPVNEPDPIQVTINTTNNDCNSPVGGTADASTVSGGTAPYSYSWSISASTAPVITGLTGGTYTLTITDANNCELIENFSVLDSALFGFSFIAEDVTCNGGNDGTVRVELDSLAVAPISYQWSTGSTDSNLTGISAGTYTVTVTDNVSCPNIDSVVISEPTAISISISGVTSLGCSSDCNAEALVTVTGGTAPYNFNWSGGQTGNNPRNLCFGPNVIEVTDTLGCIAIDTVFIGATDTVIAVVPEVNIVCDGDSIALAGSSIGNNISSFGWYLSDTTTLITDTTDTTIFRAIGDYRFFFIVSNGTCHDTTEYNVSVVGNPLVNVPREINIFKDEVASISLGNADQSYTYNWSPGTDLDDSTIANPVSSTRETITYTLTVRDTNDCEYVDSLEVIYSEELDIPSGLSPNGDGRNDVWNIGFLAEFPRATVQIYNRWGELLYEQKNGYNVPWDGTYKGEALPVGTYYYVIDLNSDRFEPMTGPITIIK